MNPVEFLDGFFIVTANRGVPRNLLQGDKRGGLGTEVLQKGPGAEPRWGLRAKPPEAGDKC